MKKKIIWIIIGILIITLLFVFNKKEDITKDKLDIPTLRVDFKEVCNIKIDGFNNEASAILTCEIPELKKRKELYEKDFTKNLTTFIDEYSEDKKVEIMKNRERINSLNSSNICNLDKNSLLKNGDSIIVSCNDILKELNYKTKNDKWNIKVENLKELPPIELEEIKKVEASKKDEVLPKPDLKDVASTWTLGDNSYWISPADISQYEIDLKDNTGDIFLMVQEEDIDIARKKAIENGKIFAIVTGEHIYYKNTSFEVKEEFKGVTE